MVKLLDYEQNWNILEGDRNPFATVVMAHLKALETRGNPGQRKDWKFNLTRRLYERGFERKDILNLFRFIDWVLMLPRALEEQFQDELESFERDMQMPYVTSIERNAEERGRQEGLRTATLEAIELGLELKFGHEGLALMSAISQIEDLETLRAIRGAIRTASAIAELQQTYQD
ncbi:hypothetical protein GS597_06675 [Synechococcales cyanobacterium C]|uniref:Transposase n=1 Tax=Petrachloros mirabilis ULC683 TaxID=2781853 RepID=A0A8K1ZY04_9CYAN|nr:hypothetical protein [Petrachloros mirabilis]NCJ06207.1 hypothetical protein [Petrachloros mirabilis ULC683]